MRQVASWENEQDRRRAQRSVFRMLTPKQAFILVSFSLGELGDGLNIFQGIYLVGIGWKEGSVGLALSLMGLTALVIQPWAGDAIDKTTFDRRIFLGLASLVTALSASAILLVRTEDDNATYAADHWLIFITKIIEGVSSSFIGPCLAALTLGSFGPHHFDKVMASNILWGHVGSVVAAVMAGAVAYYMYPNIQYCFLVIGMSALLAILFVQHLPLGDRLMGRGFAGKFAMDEQGQIERLESDESTVAHDNHQKQKAETVEPPAAAAYWEVFSDVKTCILCATGFFFHFANANVLLVLGEIMGQDDQSGGHRRSAIPLVAGAIVLAQVTMAVATGLGDKLARRGVGRKPLFLAGLATLPFRCALIILWQHQSEGWLLSTQILDGIGGGLCGLVHPYLVADITFGSGRFNVIMGLTAACFGLGATLSNFLGQLVVEKYGHATSLMASLVISIVPIFLFLFMPETLGRRGQQHYATQQCNTATAISTTTSYPPYEPDDDDQREAEAVYKSMA